MGKINRLVNNFLEREFLCESGSKRVTIGELIVTLREIPTVQLTAAQRPRLKARCRSAHPAAQRPTSKNPWIEDFLALVFQRNRLDPPEALSLCARSGAILPRYMEDGFDPWI